MKTVAIESQKGGTGKTTIGINVAVAAALAGSEVVLIDLDPQASATAWRDGREADKPVVVSVAAARLPQALERTSRAEPRLRRALDDQIPGAPAHR